MDPIFMVIAVTLVLVMLWVFYNKMKPDLTKRQTYKEHKVINAEIIEDDSHEPRKNIRIR